MANLVSRKDKKIPDFQDQIDAVGVVDSSGNLIDPSSGGFSLPQYDYFSVAYPDSLTEIYSFYQGGSGGTLVSMVTIVYTDTSKAFISSATLQ